MHGVELSTLLSAIQHDFDALDDLLRGISAVGELTPRTTDLVVSFGERMSSQIVAAAFAIAGWTERTSMRASASRPTISTARPFRRSS